MKIKHKLTTILITSTLLMSATTASQWQGKSGAYAIKITPQELVLTAPQKTSLIAPLSDMGDEEMRCEASRASKPLSFVGPFFSFEQADYWNCLGTAHPSSITTFRTLDLKTLKPVTLTSIFPDKQVLTALLNDGIVKKHLRQKSDFSSSQALINYLSRSGTGDCMYAFTTDNLSRFAFHHVKGNQVAVRMGLSHGCEAARGNLTQLGFYLPIPAHLQKGFQQANLSKEGFLMKAAPTVQTNQTVKTPGYDEEVEKRIGG